MEAMDAKEILTRVKTGTLDAASAAALLRAAASGSRETPATAPATGPADTVSPERAAELLRAAAPRRDVPEPVAVVGYSARFPERRTPTPSGSGCWTATTS